jgi:hypothetical protein
MPTKWDQAELQRHIDDGVEENLNLDYKAGDALGTSDGKKKEITKDVSAMANSAGGVIIYGIKEHDEEDKKHLPEKFTPIDRTQFSREWLEQIINSIQPRITGIKIHPVNLNTDPNHVAYVVEIPQSTTAHQARDWRYYRRFNFESVPMNDYEVRDVMHRAILPDVDVEFIPIKSYPPGSFDPEYRLNIMVSNQGDQVVERYRLHFSFPNFGDQMTLRRALTTYDHYHGHYWVQEEKDTDEYLIVFSSKDVLFPEDAIDIGQIAGLTYKIDSKLHHRLMAKKNTGSELKVKWSLYADAMPRKSGEIRFSNLYDPNR